MYSQKNSLYFFFFIIIFCACNNNSKHPGQSTGKNANGSDTSNVRNIIVVPAQRAFINPVPAGAPEILNVSDPFVIPTNSNIRLAGEPTVYSLPEEPEANTPGENSFTLPKIISPKGKIVACKQPVPLVSLPPRFKDATICNLQYVDVDQGMNSPFVRCILNDKDGNLWFGTKGGVSRYDGRSFLHFTDREGLSNNDVYSILQDKDNNFWFGTEGGGVNFYNGKTFTHFTEKDGFSSTILSMMQDKKGNIWFATVGDGVWIFDGKAFTQYTSEQGLCDNSIREIVEDKKGNIWFASNGSGVSRYNGKSFTNFSVKEGLSDNIVLSMLVDNDGNMWFGTNEGGVDLFDGKSFTNYNTKQGLSDNCINSMYQDKLGNFWFGTYAHGANCFDGKTFTWFTQKEGLSNNGIMCMQEDNAGNLWIGTLGGGANRYDGKLFTHYTGNEGFSSSTVRSILEDKHGVLWFGTYGDGVISYDGKSFSHYGSKQGLSSIYIKAILEDKDGNLWFGTDDGGAIRYDGKKFSNYKTEQGLCSDVILSLLEDSDGNIWFGTDEGVSRFDGNTFTNFTRAQGLTTNPVLCMREDNCGNIWFGTEGSGAFKFDGTTFKHYTKKQGLSSNIVNAIFQDKKENLWFGTGGAGLCYLDKNSLCSRQLTFKRFSEKNGLSNNDVISILEDKKNNFWVTTENGLNSIVKTKGKSNTTNTSDSLEDNFFQILVYTTASGLKANNFFPNSAFIDSKNNVWWGSGKALSKLDLNTFELSYAAPHIQLTSIELEQTFIDFNVLHDSLKTDLPILVGDKIKKSLEKVRFDEVADLYNYPKNLELPYYIDHVTFHFSAIDWSAPEKILYQFMLKGFDKDWSPLTTDNKALYGNLPYGEYTFKVKAIGQSQKWSNVFEYKFVIDPPWWKTWIAYFLYVVATISLVYFVIRWRTAQLLAQQKMLEITVAERTAEVVEQKELIEEKQKEIVDSINYAQRIQKALLASDKLLNDNLKNYFLFFKPKDIVSGDFYWASHLVNGNFALVTADSTGHGVPGAMMSMLNISCLNEAINERKLISPAEILNHARQRIIQSLAQDGSLEGGKDGMDCSLVIFDFKNKKLTYASANNPIWIARKNETGTELIDLKSDRMPVGKHERDNVSFNEQTIDLKAGDVIYTLTDGYADQFGGEKGKKFKYKQLQQILIAKAEASLDAQKQNLENEFNNWRGTLEQVDDVCIIGVKI